MGRMGGRFDRGDAGRAPGGLRYLVGPLQRGEPYVTRCNRYHDDRVVFLDRFFHQPGAVDAGWRVCDSCRLSVPGIGIVEAGKKRTI